MVNEIHLEATKEPKHRHRRMPLDYHNFDQ